MRAPAPSSTATPPPASTGDHERQLRFLRRMHAMRSLGLGLGFLCVAAVLHENGAAWPVWGLLAFHGFVWPHVAYALARRSVQPARAEHRNLLVDSAAGGAWIALMQFSLLPSVLAAAMLTADKMALRGPAFALRHALVLAGACLATALATGFAVRLESSMTVVAACVPFLVAYPIALSRAMNELSRRIASQNRMLQALSTTDELTGLVNRRQGLAIAERELAVHRRTGHPAVLVALDVDRFKTVNDRYGHPAGDVVLRVVADALRECVRASDVVSRCGGDEFLLVLPATTLDDAAALAARLRARLRQSSFPFAADLVCTLSLGAAEANAYMVDVEDWIQQADAALYRAKRDGRDRLVCAPALASGRRREHDAGEAAMREAS